MAASREATPNLPAICELFAGKTYSHRETGEDCQHPEWFLRASHDRRPNEPKSIVPALYNRFVSAIRRQFESLFNRLIQRTGSQDAFARSYKLGFESAKLWHSRCRLFIAPFLLLIRKANNTSCKARRL